jgi:hypothetical protein
LEDFYRAPGMRDGRRGDCKACNLAAKKRRYDADPSKVVRAVQAWRRENPERFREYQAEYRSRPENKRKMRDLYYRRTFGITADDFDRMLAEQSGACAICGERPEVEARMHVDHEHATGRIRGILCSRCNHAIGLLREDVALFERAVRYLRAR